MKSICFAINIFCILGGSLMSQGTLNGKVEVYITNAPSDKGTLYIGLYDSEENFYKTRFRQAMSTLKNGSAHITFENLPEGTYAISIFHDENHNQKLDTNFLGIPKEATGCSNNAKGFMSAPSWKNAAFQVKNTSVDQHIKL